MKQQTWFEKQKSKITLWALLAFLIQAEYVIVKYSMKVDNLEIEAKDNKILHQSFINTFFDLGVNPYKYIPNETTVRGGQTGSEVLKPSNKTID